MKRVVGVPGDTVQLRNDVLYLNGIPQQYSATDSAPFRRDVFEDANPVVSIEHLEECDHYVMSLPSRQAFRNFGPIVVPPDQYFMMGDSRDNSADSRFIGPIPREKIVGRVPRVILSVDPSRYFRPRPQRFLQPMNVDEAYEIFSRRSQRRTMESPESGET